MCVVVDRFYFKNSRVLRGREKAINLVLMEFLFCSNVVFVARTYEHVSPARGAAQ